MSKAKRSKKQVKRGLSKSRPLVTRSHLTFSNPIKSLLRIPEFRPVLKKLPAPKRMLKKSSVKNLDTTKTKTPTASLLANSFNEYKSSVCRSRSRRKQILFANNKAGKGGNKKPQWSNNSLVKCKG